MIVFKLILIFVISYIIGSIPTGYLIVKKLKGIDIRKTGSGSTGATNVKRILGTKWFFIVMFLDALKGAIPVLITSRYFNFVDVLNLSPIIAAIATVIGHSKSVFLNFTGGKSVATSVGTIIAISWPIGTIVAVVWALITFVSKYVSLGSVVAICLAPILINCPYIVPHPDIYRVTYMTLCALYVIILHKDNIKRLLTNKENKVRK